MAKALLPLKDLVQAKSRLAGLLTPSERRALAQAMVEDVLSVLAVHPRISEVTLVSDDPAAGLLASQYGICHWPESGLGCRGLNAVLAAASARLLADSGEALLVLHADLPLLSTEEVSAVLDRQCELGGLVVGCDRDGAGTNLLAFDPAGVPAFCFGQDSCRKHVMAAREAGLNTAVMRLPGVALDIDRPRDLAALLAAAELPRTGRPVASHTLALLRGPALNNRMNLALSSLRLAAGPASQEQTG